MERFFIEIHEVESRLASRESVFSWNDRRILDPVGYLIESDAFPLKTFTEIAESGNAIIVAEGGMGKSFILEKFKKTLSSNSVTKLDLAFYQENASELREDIINGCKSEYLFLDGVDEAPNLCPVLLRTLKDVPSSAHIVLASRMILQLKNLAETLNYPIFSLLPYTRENICSVCRGRDVDAICFLDEVEKNGLGSVCAKPLGCNLLLSFFKDGKLDVKSKEELWEAAIRRLCDENLETKTRDLIQDDTVLTSTESWNIAIQTALILKLANKSTIPSVSELHGFEDSELCFPEIIQNFNAKKFNKCLLRALFVAIDHKHYRFAHMTYCDFLAAKGLIEYVNSVNWRTIIFSPDGYPYPQWEGVIPWLAVSSNDILEIIKNVRPDLLLESDAVIDKVGVDEICRAILRNSTNIPESIRGNPNIQARYCLLNTDECVRELVAVLERDCTMERVDTAFDIIQQAQLTATVNVLVKFFCDASKDISLRATAGRLLLNFANESQRQQCRVVLSTSIPKQLKGVAFELLWPKFMSAEELRPFLEPSTDNVIDSYTKWLTFIFIESLKDVSDSNLRVLLRWAIDNVCESYADYHFEGAVYGVFVHCWQALSSSEDLMMLAKGLEVFTRFYHSPFSKRGCHHNHSEYCEREFASDVVRRRRMITFIVEHEEAPLSVVVSFYLRLVQKDDIGYLIEEASQCADSCVLRRWIMCLEEYANWIELPRYSKGWDWLHQNFPAQFERDSRTELQSREAQRLMWEQKEARFNKKDKANNEKKEEAYMNALTFVHTYLKDEDVSRKFSQIMRAIQSQTDGPLTDFCLDFRKSRIWRSLSEKEILCLVYGAYGFLLAYNGPFSSEKEYYPEHLQAFYLLMIYDSSKLRDLPSDVWQRFAPELLMGLDWDIFDSVSQTMELFATHHHEIFIIEVFNVLKTGLVDENSLTLRIFERLLHSKDVVYLLDALDNAGIVDEQRTRLYAEFYRFYPTLTLTHINHLYGDSVSLDACNYNITPYLILVNPEARFQELIHCLNHDLNWGVKWALRILGQDRYDNGIMSECIKLIKPRTLSNFYIWLRINFPPEKEPHHMGCYSPGPIDNVYEFIGRTLNELVMCEDNELPEVLDDLLTRFSDMTYLHECKLRAQRRLLEIGCPNYDIPSIKKLMATESESMVINTAEDLLRVVCRVLMEYQIYLTGAETPQIESLWNTAPGNVSHKDEEAFSDNIKVFLNEKLQNVVINREVQLRRGRGNVPGARTDIWITAVSGINKSRIRLCIEVKGCWNKECRTAFEKQLCERYMDNDGADAGIYLVGWFESSQSPKLSTQWDSQECAKEFLKDQELGLQEKGYCVHSMVVNCTY